MLDKLHYVAAIDKYQAICLAPSRQERLLSDDMILRGSIIQSVPSINILGINIDEKLTSTSHIEKICRKAGRQVIFFTTTGSTTRYGQ